MNRASWVLLRGLTREARHWGAFPDLLRSTLPDVRVLTPDLPGNGCRWRERSPSRIEAMVEDVRQILRMKEASPPYYLLGLSLGAMVAAAWSHAWPREVAGAVLASTSLATLSPLHQRLRPANFALLPLLLAGPLRWREASILRLTSARPGEHRQVLAAWEAWRRECPVSATNALRQLLAAARCRVPADIPATPMLVLAGARDRLVDPVCSEDLAHAWNAPLVICDNAGHDLPLDAGPWMAECIREWLVTRPRQPVAGSDTRSAG